METKKFEQQVAEITQAQEHAQEIQQTRVGGLGGSDAAILMKIGERGLSALSMTDNKRLAIMLGLSEQTDWGGNSYTNAGHMFEDYAEKNLPWGIADNTPKNYKRELVIDQKLAISFKTFAHADFAIIEGNNTHVIECKFVQQDTAKVEAKYYAQLQWYHMLGAKSVQLYHGTGNVEPFEVLECSLVEIERDEVAIKTLLNGIKILDEAIQDGWKPENVEKIDIEDTPKPIQDAFARWQEIKAKKAELEIAEKEMSAEVKEYLEDFGFTGIVAEGEVKHQVIYKRGGTSFTFNSDKFLQEHPEFDKPEYYKKTTTKSSVTFK